MCDHGIRKVEKQDFDEALIDNIGDFIGSAAMVDLTGLGEPLLSGLFWKILDRFPVTETTTDDEYFLTFNTNGTLLNKSNIDRILGSRISKIRVSIDSAKSDLFHKIRGVDLAEIVAGARRLVEARNTLQLSRPRIGIEMTLMKESLDDVPGMIDLCKEIGVDFLEVWSINAHPPHMTEAWKVQRGNWTFSYRDQMLVNIPRRQMLEIVESYHQYALTQGIPVASYVSDIRLASDDFPREIGIISLITDDGFGGPRIVWTDKSIRCDMPWQELRVTYEGNVYACCWQPTPIGNIGNQTLADVWNSAAMRELRSELMEGVIPRLCSGASCSYIEGRKREHPEWAVAGDGRPASLELSAAANTAGRMEGVHELESYLGRPLRWTTGDAKFTIRLARAEAPTSVAVKLWNITGVPDPVRVHVNGLLTFDAALPPDGLDKEFPVGAGADATVIRIESKSFQPAGDPRNLGVAIEKLELRRY
jgi:MoaA/NifB/PqqE/SkfB family radical SAM enzyme